MLLTENLCSLGRQKHSGGKGKFLFSMSVNLFLYRKIYLKAKYINIYVYKYVTNLFLVLSPLNLKIFLGLLFPSCVKPLGGMRGPRLFLDIPLKVNMTLVYFSVHSH